LEGSSEYFLNVPFTVCTGPERYDDLDHRILRKRWSVISGVRVKFSGKQPETISTADFRDVYGLYSRSDASLRHAVFLDFLHDLPWMEVLILLAFILLWWVGRLIAAVSVWIGKGFSRQ